MEFTNIRTKVISLRSKIKGLTFYACLFYLVLFVAGILGSPAQAGTFVSDDFNESSINAAWDISFTKMKKGEKDWIYFLDKSNLVVTKIKDRSVNNKWSTVTLSQTFDPLSDFDIDLGFSWDLMQGKKKIKSAVQTFYINLYDTDNNLISSVGYKDTSVTKKGNIIAKIADKSYVSNVSGSNGKESINLLRQDDTLNMSWNDKNILSGISSGDLGKIDVVFSYSKKQGHNRTSYFGTESVDFIKVKSAPPVVPEPVSSVLFVSGGAVLAGRYYFRKKRKL
jgi:hypothetical protein